MSLYAQLYDPARIPASLPGLAQLAEEAQTTIQSYGDIVLPKLPQGLDSVEPGTGAVLQVLMTALLCGVCPTPTRVYSTSAQRGAVADFSTVSAAVRLLKAAGCITKHIVAQPLQCRLAWTRWQHTGMRTAR